MRNSSIGFARFLHRGSLSRDKNPRDSHNFSIGGEVRCSSGTETGGSAKGEETDIVDRYNGGRTEVRRSTGTEVGGGGVLFLFLRKGETNTVGGKNRATP